MNRQDRADEPMEVAADLVGEGGGGATAGAFGGRVARALLDLGGSNAAFLGKAALSLVLRGLAAVSSMALNILLGRALGPSALGLYFLALTIARTLGQIGVWGTDQSGTRWVARHVALGNLARARGAAVGALFLASVICGVMGAALYVFAEPIAVHVFSNAELVKPLQAVSPIVFWHGLTLVLSGLLVGLDRAGAAVFVNALGVPVMAALLFGLVFDERTLDTALLATLLATAATAFIGGVVWAYARHDGLGKGPNAVDISPLAGSGLSLMTVGLMVRAQEWLTLLVLGMFAPTSEVAFYGLAARIAGLLGIVLVAVNMTVRGRYARLDALGDREGLERLARLVNLLTMAIAAVPMGILLVFPHTVLSIFGHGFKEGALILQILTFMQWVSVSMGSVGQLLLMSGNEKVSMRIATATALLLAAGLFAVVPFFGAVGAAALTAAIIVVQRVWTSYEVRRRLGIRLGLAGLI